MPIFPSRLHLAVAVLTVIVLGFDVTGLVTGIPRERRERVEDRESIKASLQDRLKEVNATHSELTKARRSTTEALDALQKMADLLRSPGGVGIPEAQASWEATKGAYTAARTTLLGDKASLIPKTKRLIDETGKARKQIKDLLSLLEEKADRDYLEALDVAYGLLATAHTGYLKVYEELVKAMAHYEPLYEKTDAFLAEHAKGRFKTPKDASTAYVSRTNDVVKPLQDMRPGINEATQKAAKDELAASRAFKEAAVLRTKT